eukprot:15349233-Ditylum_brightwellii.AAC.1
MAYTNDDIHTTTTHGGADLKDLLSHNFSLYLDVARVEERCEINVVIPKQINGPALHQSTVATATVAQMMATAHSLVQFLQSKFARSDVKSFIKDYTTVPNKE